MKVIAGPGGGRDGPSTKKSPYTDQYRRNLPHCFLPLFSHRYPNSHHPQPWTGETRSLHCCIFPMISLSFQRENSQLFCISASPEYLPRTLIINSGFPYLFPRSLEYQLIMSSHASTVKSRTSYCSSTWFRLKSASHSQSLSSLSPYTS